MSGGRDLKTRLRWFWVALGAFLAAFGEEFLRKLLAVSLCGFFLLSYCLPEAKFSDAVVAQTSQSAVVQSQTGQKIDDYFNPIQKDGQPKLGIDRWWATAGVDKEITVNWTVKVEKRDDYYLNFPVSKINKNTKVIVFDSKNNVLNTIKAPFTPAYSNLAVWRLKKDNNDQDLGGADKIYTLRIENLSVPVEPVVEEVKLAVGTIKTLLLRTDGVGYDYEFNMTDELKTLFITDSQEVNKKYPIKVKEKYFNSQNQGNALTDGLAKKELSKSELINYFTPILSFESEDEAQFPLDVNLTTWAKSVNDKSLRKGDSQGFLDLSQFKKKKYTGNKPAKIYASIVEKQWKDKKYKQEISELAINYYFHYSQSNWKDHGGFNNHEGDWEGITLFLRKDGDNRYYPCRIAFAQHVNFARDVLGKIPILDEWKGGQVVEWSNLKLRLADDRYNITDVAQNPTKTQIFQPSVYVGLGGHASYPDNSLTDYKIENPDQIGSTKYLTGREYHRGGKEVNLRGKVEYLPRVGQGINAKELKGKDWLLYPGTWGNPNACSTKLPLDIGCPSAPRSPVFLDLKFVALGSKSEGLGQRWLDPWEWSKEFKGADEIKDCPPPKEEPKPEPSPEISPKPDGSTGSVFGDPHIVTLDGLRNSFQAAGEFILARSSSGNFEVQTRFAPVGKNASLTTAVVVKIGSDRIGIYPSNQLRINGQRSNLAEGSVLSLQGGGRLLRQGNNYTISAPTGEFLQVAGGSSLTVNLTVPKNRRGTIRGLLGNYNGKAEDDLQTRDGKSLPTNPSYDQLYKVFGKSWRISQDESLFDYGAGETVATFALLDFPEKVLTLADFSVQQKQEAEKVCRSAGVTNSALLESCLFDVLVTGDRSFANISAYVQSKVKVTANVTPLTGQKKPTVPKNQPGISLISKKSGVNYTRLRDFLAAGKIWEADKETTKAMKQAATRGFVYRMDNFPCEDLKTINQLWLHYSNGIFGFSILKEIYESLGGYDRAEPPSEVWEKLKKRGLASTLNPISDEKLAPKGSLPWDAVFEGINWECCGKGRFPFCPVSANGSSVCLLTRVKACKL